MILSSHCFPNYLKSKLRSLCKIYNVCLFVFFSLWQTNGKICSKAGVSVSECSLHFRKKTRRRKILLVVTQFKLASFLPTAANHQFKLSPFCASTSLRSVGSQPLQPADGTNMIFSQHTNNAAAKNTLTT